MKGKFILVHDLGTGGDKAVLVDSDQGLVASAFASYKTKYLRPMVVEQDPNQWWKAVCESTQLIISRSRIPPKAVGVVTFSGQMMGCLPISEKGQPLHNAIIWADQRATDEAQTLVREVGLKETYRITGQRISPAHSAPKIMWLAINKPELYKQTYKFLQAKDYIAYKFTGNYVTDFSDACGTGLFDIHRKCWSEKLLQSAAIDPRKLPQVFPSTQIVGEITPKAADETGLAPGTPVVIGGGDGVCAAAGAGAIEEHITHVYLGSSAWVGGAAHKPLLDPRMRIFTWVHLVPNLYSPNGTMHNAGSCLEWAKSNLGGVGRVATQPRLSAYEILEKQASEVPPGAGGLLFLPYLMGERSPYWNPNARGAFLGLTEKHTSGHLFRAVLEGVAFNLRTIISIFTELGMKVEVVRLIGGGARSKLWTKILADVFSLPIETTSSPLEATALGAAMAGAVGAGLVGSFSLASERFVRFNNVVEPDPIASQAYRGIYETFLEAYRALVPTFDSLAKFQLKEKGENSV